MCMRIQDTILESHGRLDNDKTMYGESNVKAALVICVSCE